MILSTPRSLHACTGRLPGHGVFNVDSPCEVTAHYEGLRHLQDHLVIRRIPTLSPLVRTLPLRHNRTRVRRVVVLGRDPSPKDQQSSISGGKNGDTDSGKTWESDPERVAFINIRVNLSIQVVW